MPLARNMPLDALNWERVRLCVEHPLVQRNDIVLSKYEVEIFERLGKEKALRTGLRKEVG
jgi:hypothetical protein